MGRFDNHRVELFWVLSVVIKERSIVEIHSGPFTIVVGSRGVNLYDRSFFYNNGQDPKQFDAVVVKSPH
ncbi:MAG: MlrC C-terminal domain-containing protein, partial [Pirellula sp.]